MRKQAPLWSGTVISLIYSPVMVTSGAATTTAPLPLQAIFFRWARLPSAPIFPTSFIDFFINAQSK